MYLRSAKTRFMLATLVLILLLSPLSSIFAAELPEEVWVDTLYNTETPDYGITRFCSIQDAVDMVRENGTVYVAPGSYYGFFVHTQGLSILASDGAIVDGSLQAEPSALFGISTGIYVEGANATIQGFTIQNWDGAGIYVAGSRLRSATGILLPDPDPEYPQNVLIQNNRLQGNREGIVSYGNSVRIVDNFASENEFIGIAANGQDVIIRGNTLSNNGEYGLIWSGDNFIVENNTTAGAVIGFYGEGSRNSLVRNNSATGNEGGLFILGVGNTISDNIVNHNTVIGILNATLSLKTVKPLVITPDLPEENVFTDNTVQYNGGGEMSTIGSVSLSQLKISQEEVGGGIYTTVGGIYRGNHIEDNEGFGLYVIDVQFAGVSTDDPPDAGPVDAILNWWGHTSGPYHPISNPSASGQEVSNNATYSPWLLAAPSAPKPVETRTEYLEEGESITIDGAVSAHVTGGQGTVTVGQYESNPVSKSLFGSAGAYVDVYVTTPHEIDELVVYMYYTGTPENEGELILHFWTGTDWIACSDSGVNLDGKYVWAVITADSLPSLSELTGTEFGAGLVQQEDPDDDEKHIDLPNTGAMDYTGLGLVIMAAGVLLTKKRYS